MRHLRTVLGAWALIGLVACGGNGAIDGAAAPDSPPAPSTGAASVHALAGAWTDSRGDGQLFVAADGQAYGLLSDSGTNRLLRGTLSAQHGLVSPSGFDAVDMGVPDSRQRWSLTGSYQPQSQLLLASDSGALVVSAVYDARSAHGADLAALAGTYEVTLYGNGRPTITYLATLGDSGGIDLAGWQDGQEQCRLRGALTAASPAVNILNARLLASGAGCQFPDGTGIQGLAQYDADHALLVLFGMSGSGDGALVLYANRIRA